MVALENILEELVGRRDEFDQEKPLLGENG